LWNNLCVTQGVGIARSLFVCATSHGEKIAPLVAQVAKKSDRSLSADNLWAKLSLSHNKAAQLKLISCECF